MGTYPSRYVTAGLTPPPGCPVSSPDIWTPAVPPWPSGVRGARQPARAVHQRAGEARGRRGAPRAGSRGGRPAVEDAGLREAVAVPRLHPGRLRDHGLWVGRSRRSTRGAVDPVDGSSPQRSRGVDPRGHPSGPGAAGTARRRIIAFGWCWEAALGSDRCAGAMVPPSGSPRSAPASLRGFAISPRARRGRWTSWNGSCSCWPGGASSSGSLSWGAGSPRRRSSSASWPTHDLVVSASPWHQIPNGVTAATPPAGTRPSARQLSGWCCSMLRRSTSGARRAESRQGSSGTGTPPDS